MAQVNTPHRQIARLSFTDGEVVVTPKDQDIFLISAERATRACRQAVQDDQRIERFTSEFLVPLHAWCISHAEQVKACYIPRPAAQIQVFIVTKSAQFDFNLAERVAALELSLAKKGWRVGVMQLPNTEQESLATFFRPEGALEIYAEPGPAPGEGGK